jgi:hypothetical protein
VGRPLAPPALRAVSCAPLAQQCRGSFLVLLGDRASGHLRPRLAVPDTSRSRPHPAGRPAVNPAEQSWDELREKGLPDMACSSVPPVVNTRGAGSRALSAAPERGRSLPDFPY